MRYRFFQILALVLLVLWAAMVWAGPCVLNKAELSILGLINQARRDPAAMALRVGLAPDQILATRPELAHIFANGLHPLAFSPKLQAAARGHATDMAAQGYYGYESPEGLAPFDRVKATGYLAVAVKESLGMLSFLNYMGLEEASWGLFSNMYTQELTGDSGELKILAPDVEDVGISVVSARFSLQGYPSNVYISTCDFGKSKVSQIARELMALIDQARANPLGVAEDLGMDPEELIEQFPELAEVFHSGLPPLAWDERLFDAAYMHGQDMLERGYFSHITPEGLGWEERIEQAGYPASSSGEAMALLVFTDEREAREVAKSLFERIFRREFSETRNILNPEFKEAGVAFVRTVPGQLDDESSDFAPFFNYLLVVNLAAPIEPGPSAIVGNVYEDKDHDGLYDLGEGLAAAVVAIGETGADPVCELTDGAGGVEMALGAGDFVLSVACPDGSPISEGFPLHLGDENHGFFICVAPGE